jgi:hypothetical protein
MEGIDQSYVALHDIDYNSVRAYNKGDTVHAAAVEGPDAWLTLGEDVQAREGSHLDRPAKSASQAAWAAYAISEGLDPDEAQGSSRKDLIAAYGDDDTKGKRAAGSEGDDGKLEEPTSPEAVATGVDEV